MDIAWWKKTGALAGLLVMGAACGETTEPEGPQTEDGVVKAADSEGKADRWNWRNNPSHFRTELDYTLDNLPANGAADGVAWAASYWPYYQDGINHRWQGRNVLSPAEKYDRAFNGWEPAENFMDLEPYDTRSCEWDDEYYTSLGPAAKWTGPNRGNQMARNGFDDDGDGLTDQEECGWGENKDMDGVETWWGICHAWAPAAILEEEPLRPVTRNGIEFAVSDIKALLIQQYDRVDAYMLGGRCNEKEVERDETGRITNSECRDLNAGTWHVIVTNFLGKNSRPFVIERVWNYEVWNQPLVGYEITKQEEISLERAHELLQVAAEEEAGTGEFVHGIEEGTPLADAVLKLANTASLQELDEDVALDERAANYITWRRPFDTLAQLDEVPYVAERAFGKLQSYVEENDLVDSAATYAYNPDATRFVEVKMTTNWITESHASTEPTTPRNDRYMRHDYYHYILELDENGAVIGGEWLGSSRTNHPDFIWLPVRARAGNPYLDLDVIRDMVRESRSEVDGDEDDDTNNPHRSFTVDGPVTIPDNDPNGATSTLTVSETGTVKTVKIDLDIAHTYRGDLRVDLAHGGVVVEVYDGSKAEQPWADGVTLEGQQLEGFLGATLEGEWELRVYDTYSWDTGEVTSWTLHVEAD